MLTHRSSARRPGIAASGDGAVVADSGRRRPPDGPGPEVAALCRAATLGDRLVGPAPRRPS